MRRCPRCGASYSDDLRFCTDDGTRLDAVAAGPTRGVLTTWVLPVAAVLLVGTLAMAWLLSTRDGPEPGPIGSDPEGEVVDAGGSMGGGMDGPPDSGRMGEGGTMADDGIGDGEIFDEAADAGRPRWVELQRVSAGGRVFASFRTPADEVRFGVVEGGRVVDSTGIALSLGTSVSGLEIVRLDGRSVALFRAQDDRWTTDYAYDLDRRVRHFRAREQRTGRVRHSDGLRAGSALARRLGYVPEAIVPPPPPAAPRVLRSVGLGNGWAARIVDDGDVRAVEVIDGRAVLARCSQTFSLTTTFDGLQAVTLRGDQFVLFTATDARWRTHYAWHHATGHLYWRTRSRRSGEVRRSPNLDAGSALDRALG